MLMVLIQIHVVYGISKEVAEAPILQWFNNFTRFGIYFIFFFFRLLCFYRGRCVPGCFVSCQMSSLIWVCNVSFSICHNNLKEANFRESNSVIFIASLLYGSQLLKERICSSGSKFFPLRVDPLRKGFHL